MKLLQSCDEEWLWRSKNKDVRPAQVSSTLSLSHISASGETRVSHSSIAGLRAWASGTHLCTTRLVDGGAGVLFRSVRLEFSVL